MLTYIEYGFVFNTLENEKQISDQFHVLKVSEKLGLFFFSFCSGMKSFDICGLFYL